MDTTKNNLERRSWMTRNRFLKYGILMSVILLLARRYFPIELEQALRIKGLSEQDISHIAISVDSPERSNEGLEHSPENSTITNKALIREVLSVFSSHRMRRMAPRQVYYFPSGGPEKPGWIRLHIHFADGSNPVFVTIPSGAQHISVNGTFHKLYGERLDNMKLWAILGESLSPN